MDQQNQAVLLALVGALSGAIVGGGTVIIILDRIVKAILNSPVLIRNLEILAASWPAPVRESIADLGKLAQEISDDTPSDQKPPGQTVNVNVASQPAIDMQNSPNSSKENVQ